MEVPVLNMLAELNRGFMLALIMYSNEKDATEYANTLHSTLVVANDIKTLANMLSIKDLPNDCEELCGLMQDFGDIDKLTLEDVKRKSSEINLASVENCIQDVRKKLSFLNDKYNYYDE